MRYYRGFRDVSMRLRRASSMPHGTAGMLPRGCDIRDGCARWARGRLAAAANRHPSTALRATFQVVPFPVASGNDRVEWLVPCRASGAKARPQCEALIAALKRCATQKRPPPLTRKFQTIAGTAGFSTAPEDPRSGPSGCARNDGNFVMRVSWP